MTALSCLGVFVNADAVTIRNSVIDGTGLAYAPLPFVLPGAESVTVSGNSITNWAEGAYIVQGSTGAFDHNVFVGNGNGVTTESVLVRNIFEDSFQARSEPTMSAATGRGGLRVHYHFCPMTTNPSVSPHGGAGRRSWQRRGGKLPRVDSSPARAFMAAGETTSPRSSMASSSDAARARRRRGQRCRVGRPRAGRNSAADEQRRSIGDSGNDTIGGDDGNDSINGGDGIDVIFGGAGNDELGGGVGDDIIVGEDGDDVIFGEDGIDVANGGAGADIDARRLRQRHVRWRR